MIVKDLDSKRSEKFLDIVFTFPEGENSLFTLERLNNVEFMPAANNA